MGENVMYALEIMGKGMASIFVVIILLTLIVMLMAKIGESSTKTKDKIIKNKSIYIHIKGAAILSY